MVGFVGALIGGALKGWGTGTVEEIKQKREEKLKELDRQFQSQENALTRGVQKEQIAATERQTAASLAVQKSLGEGQQANQMAIAKLGEAGANARTTAQLSTQEKIAQAQIDSAKTLQELQIGAAQKLNTKLTPIVKDGKTTYELTTPDGQVIPKLKGPDGKEYDWAGPDASTDAAKNYNFMIANGIKADQAAKWAFGAKSGDRDAIATQLLTGMNSSSIVPANPENQALRQKLALEGADAIIAHGNAAEGGATTPAPAPAAGTPDAATPAVPSSSSAPAAPTQPLTPTQKAQVIEAAKKALAENGDPAVIRAKLQEVGISPTAVPGL